MHVHTQKRTLSLLGAAPLGTSFVQMALPPMLHALDCLALKCIMDYMNSVMHLGSPSLARFPLGKASSQTNCLGGCGCACTQEHLLMSEHRRETKRMRAGGKDAVVNVMSIKAQEQQALQELQDGTLVRERRHEALHAFM